VNEPEEEENCKKDKKVLRRKRILKIHLQKISLQQTGQP
jgi:hypothetical protein